MLQTITDVGEGTVETVFGFGHEEMLDYLGIEAVGWLQARRGHYFQWPAPPDAMVFACQSGVGEVFAEGKWMPLHPGEVYICPVGHAKGHRFIEGEVWEIGFVIFRTDEIIRVSSPTVQKANLHGLLSATKGLCLEDPHLCNPVIIRRWVELVKIYCEELNSLGFHKQLRLKEVWDAVLDQPGYPWTVRSLADLACLSPDGLRRVSLIETGHSPMAYVTLLRMRVASSLLRAYPWRFDEIADRVGYSSTYAFSSAFKRVIGISPSSYRKPNLEPINYS